MHPDATSAIQHRRAIACQAFWSDRPLNRAFREQRQTDTFNLRDFTDFVAGLPSDQFLALTGAGAMTGRQLAVIDDLASRRSAAANKAWETRRAQGWTHNGAHNQAAVLAKPSKTAADEALAAFEREAQSDMPDWHSAALKLRKALEPGRQNRETTLVSRCKTKPLALPPSRWHDYRVDRVNSFSVRTDILVVTFADGEIVRAPAVSAKGKPTNVGRGLRIAIAFYQARACWRRGIKFRAGVHPEVPAIAACLCEDSGETFDAQECTMRTVEARAAQDWRLKPR